jgi:hypothetical protein
LTAGMVQDAKKRRYWLEDLRGMVTSFAGA